MRTDITIRPAALADLDGIAAIYNALWCNTPRNRGDAETADSKLEGSLFGDSREKATGSSSTCTATSARRTADPLLASISCFTLRSVRIGKPPISRFQEMGGSS